MIPEKTIVTIEAAGGFTKDFELPLEVPLGKWKPSFLALLKQLDAGQFGSWQDLRLTCKGQPVLPEETLAEHAAWDGSILKIERN